MVAAPFPLHRGPRRLCLALRTVKRESQRRLAKPSAWNRNNGSSKLASPTLRNLTNDAAPADAKEKLPAGCISEAKTEQIDPVAALAAALLGLSPADRARLAALLLGGQTQGSDQTAGDTGKMA